MSHPALRYLNIAPEGFSPCIPQSAKEFVAANERLDGAILPQMFAAGGVAALYFFRPVEGLYAVAASVHRIQDVREHWAFAQRMATDVSSAFCAAT
ncbi:hypothetical protein H0E84_00785 [Luteimonas sp. SJ-92]|uniref:Uncharacterized protein n=1 Tax=Luteimonas salinisoli TaxID=2752307 RepID=A0A853J8D0_9GAMM|nr:hypothetical protein [Luteimonas salinisoli]NZA24910.1 hypothetical protein [Luteimonas salinisoli]